ncbi:MULTISPECIES: hypothetical protein [unclassified Rhizobium]|jgi:hypothetical protein|uniref:hypothetical protein n=1 Tax=unclassified Rhizobium TaxID=2613769 RepID=UPI000AE88C0F|nr:MULTISPECIES: hypothetical protein [unclassified Rhizobium]RKD52054.1 hypothetical protein BJ928_11786 [Rhizobium sp. WW_1]
MQHQAVQHSYRRAFVGTAAIAFLYLLAILVSSRQTQDAFNAGNWGYALGPPVFAMLIGTLIAGYWTNKSSSEASFVRAAMRGGVIALALLVLAHLGDVAEQQERQEIQAEAIAKWKLEPMPVQVTWPSGWQVEPVQFNDKLSGFMQVANRQTDAAASFVSLVCAHPSSRAANQPLDELLKETADGFFGQFKKENIELVAGTSSDAALGDYRGRRVEFDSKSDTLLLHGEIVAAHGPSCLLLTIAYHAGQPYDAIKDVIDSFKASIK